MRPEHEVPAYERTLADRLAVSMVKTWSHDDLVLFAHRTLRDTYRESYRAFAYDWLCLFSGEPEYSPRVRPGARSSNLLLPENLAEDDPSAFFPWM